MTSPLVYIQKQYNFLESALPLQDSKIFSAARLMRSPVLYYEAIVSSLKVGLCIVDCFVLQGRMGYGEYRMKNE